MTDSCASCQNPVEQASFNMANKQDAHEAFVLIISKLLEGCISAKRPVFVIAAIDKSQTCLLRFCTQHAVALTQRGGSRTECR